MRCERNCSQLLNATSESPQLLICVSHDPKLMPPGEKSRTQNLLQELFTGLVPRDARARACDSAHDPRLGRVRRLRPFEYFGFSRCRHEGHGGCSAGTWDEIGSLQSHDETESGSPHDFEKPFNFAIEHFDTTGSPAYLRCRRKPQRRISGNESRVYGVDRSHSRNWQRQ